jgi:PAS domain S-box-containing protein
MSPKSHNKNHNITGRQHTGENVENSIEHFQASFGNMLEGVQVFGHDWRYLYLNASAEKHNRRPNQELLGRKYMDMWPGIEETHVFSVIARCMDERVASQLENRFVFPDGAEGWFMLSIQPIPDGVLILSFDITERVRAEKQVTQMKRLYATLSQVNQTIVRVKEADELYQSICNVAVQFGGFSLAWIGLLDEDSGDIKPASANGLDVNQWPFPIFNVKREPYQNGVISQALLTSTVMTSEDIQSDERTQSLHNLIRDYDFHSLAVVPFYLAGRTIGVLCLISPDTGFFKSGEEIRLLEEMGLDISFALEMMETERIKRQWADAFEHCAHGIVIGDPVTNRIRTCNPAFAREQGGTVQEFTSMPLLNMYAPRDHERIKGLIARSDRTGSVQFEAQKIRKDGSIYTVQMDLVSVRNENGNLIYRVATQQDISERKEAEEKMRESEARFSTIFENSPIALGISRLSDKKITHVNTAFTELYGYSREEAVGRTTAELDIWAIPADRQRFVEQLQTHGHVIGFESIARQKSGKEYPALVSGEVIEIDGELCLLAQVVDITARKQAEAAVRDSQARLAGVIDSAMDAIISLDAEQRIILFNPAAEGMFACPAAEALGQPPDRFIPARFRISHREHIRTFNRSNLSMRSMGTLGPLTCLRANGEEFPAEITISQAQIAGQKIYTAFLRDATERVQAQQALQTSERMLKLFVEYAPAAIAMFDRDMNYLAVSRRYIADYRLVNESIAGRSHYEIFPEIPERWKEIHRRCLAGAIEKAEEDPFLRLDGTLDWVRWEIHPWYEIPGKIGGIILFSEVITESKKTKEAALKSERQMRALVTSLDDIVFEFDEQGTYLNVWTADESLLAQPKVQMLGRRIEEVLGEENGRPFIEAVKRVLASRAPESIEYPLEVIGGQRWFLARISPIQALENAPRTVSMLIRDITEPKQAEERLQESETRFRSLIENSSDEISIITAEGNLLYESPTANPTLGYRPGEFLGQTLFQLIHPDDLERIQEQFARLIQDPNLHPRDRFRLRHHKGNWRWVEAVGTNLLSEPSVHGIVINYHDITERVQAEREIKHRTEDLLIINTLNEAANRGEDIENIVEAFARETRNAFACHDVAIYLLTPDGKYIEMQNSTLPQRATERIERLLGRPIPKIKLPVKGDGYFKKIIANEQGLLTSDPQVIQEWIEEFTETTFLPKIVRPAIRKIIPQIFEVLNIGSTISIPLISSGRTIGILDMSSEGQFTEEDLQRMRSISRQMTAILMRKQAEKQVQLQLRRLSALSEIDRAISSSLDMRLSLDVLLNEVLSQLGVDAAAVLLLNESSLTLEYCAGKGFRTLAFRQSRIRLGKGHAGQVGLERKMLHVSNLAEAGSHFARTDMLKDEGFVEYFGVPLVVKGMLKGVLEVFHRTPLNSDIDWINYLETLGGQAAIAIDNAQLFEGIQQSNLELIAAYDATIAGWSHAMDLRDRETEGHSQRVTELTLKLAEQMGISEQEQVHIRRGALLHDIGKLGIPDHILLKDGKLTEEEWAKMRRHPTFALEMLMPISYLRPALDIPYCHHEKWDGTGYPRGLKGEQIPLAARIFAVVDVWDALTSDRPYRSAWSKEKTLEYIREQSGRHFDPRVVEVFLETIVSNEI